MDRIKRNKILYELLWLGGVIVVSAIIEFFFILLLDLHPILSVKIQAFIGLVIVAYGIRMIARMGKEGIINFEDEKNRRVENHEK